MSFEQFRSSLSDQRLIQLADHWNAIRKGRKLPAWKDVDPVEIAACLPLVWAWRFDPERDAFVGILAGENIIAATGSNLRGRSVGDYFPDPLAGRVDEQFRFMVRQPAFFHATGDLRNVLGYAGRGERIGLPLASDGENGDAVMGASIYRLRGVAARHEPPEVALSDEDLRYIPVD